MISDWGGSKAQFQQKQHPATAFPECADDHHGVTEDDEVLT